MAELFDQVTDIFLIYKLYYIVMSKDDAPFEYKILITMLFCFFVGAILVHYSAFVQFMLSQGMFKPNLFNKLTRKHCCFRVLHLSFIGPFIMVFNDILEGIEIIIISISLVCCAKKKMYFVKLKKKMRSIISKVQDLKITPS